MWLSTPNSRPRCPYKEYMPNEIATRIEGATISMAMDTRAGAFTAAEDVPARKLVEQVGAPLDERIPWLHTAISQALDHFKGMPHEELLERVSQSGVMPRLRQRRPFHPPGSNYAGMPWV